METPANKRPHTCEICERNFTTARSLQYHLNVHYGIKPYECKECQTSFTTPYYLKKHIQYRHTHEKPHKCTECNYASVEKSKLKRHMRCHTGERPFQCPHCTYAAHDMSKLKRHFRTHTGEKPYKCDQCNMHFTQANSLKIHKLKHSVSEKPIFSCEFCPLKCSHQVYLRNHVRKQHFFKPHKCKICAKSFPDRYSYRIHIKTHKGEKRFKCKLCPYHASAELRHLISHTIKHTDEKPFICDQCDQSFSCMNLLRRHQNLDHNPYYKHKPKTPMEKNYSCTECQRTFARKGNLIRHLSMHDEKKIMFVKESHVMTDNNSNHPHGNGQQDVVRRDQGNQNRQSRKRGEIKTDVDTCFGFDENEEPDKNEDDITY